MRKRLLQFILVLAGILLLMEFLVRYLGVVDFPIYYTDNKIGYLPKANQRGSFLGKNDWEINSLSMANGEFSPDDRPDTLLIGDSIVWGGNSYAAHERLGPQLKKRTAGTIWSIAAGSWTLQNELTYLHQHKADVAARVDRIVFILNSGDFAGVSSWNCELTHPTRPPAIAISYLFQKYVYSFSACGKVPENLLVPESDSFAELSTFVSTSGKQTTIFFYPSKDELSNPELLEGNFIKNERRLGELGINDITYIHRDSRWNISFYKDDIHPTPEGMEILAEIIADNLAPLDSPGN